MVGFDTGAAELKREPPGGIECVLFDSDGTLVDSEPLSFVGLAEMLTRHGVRLDPERLHLEYRGWKIGEVFDVLRREHGLELPAGFEAEFRERQAGWFEEQLRAMPGVRKLLASLSLPAAVVTSGPMRKVRHALAVTGLDGFFGDNIYSACDLGVWKPDPEIYRLAARGMGHPIERCLAVEDSPIGLGAAARSGAVTVFLNRFGDSCEYENVIEIESMDELAGVIGGFLQ
jgi:HAD superfamily hydrolase (TIGR01509 family)